MKKVILLALTLLCSKGFASLNPNIEEIMTSEPEARQYVLMTLEGEGVCAFPAGTSPLPACAEEQLALMDQVMMESQEVQVAGPGVALAIVAGAGCVTGIVTETLTDSSAVRWLGRLVTAGYGYISVGGSLPGLIVGAAAVVPYEVCRGLTHALFSTPAGV